MANSFLGSGDLYIDRLTDAGVKTGFNLVGNAVKLEIAAESDIKEQTSRGKTTYGQVLASVNLAKPSKLKVSLNQLDRTVLAMAFLGDDVTLSAAGATIPDEEIAAKPGKFVELTKRNISAITITRKNGDTTATTWAVTTEYAAGAYVKPTTTPTRFYKCTTGGTSAGAEPTWPVGGLTVTDGTVVWTDMGLITLTTNEYEANAALGMIKAETDSLIVDNETLKVDYTYAAEAGYKVNGATQPTIRASLKLDGKNLTNGKQAVVTVHHAQIKPSSAIDFLSDDFSSLELEGTMITPTGLTTPFTYEEID